VSISSRFTSKDLERLPDIEGIRYEIVDGELYVSKTPRWEHQYASDGISVGLRLWSDRTGLGVSLSALGLVFAEDDDVIPDVVWISLERLATAIDDGGHLRVAPELVIEVISPGRENERRDREVKLALYERRGVQEYWIVDWRQRTVDVYRRIGESLQLVATLGSEDRLTSPLLPGFSCPIATLWSPTL
jgi:Uma2 family endonuclease